MSSPSEAFTYVSLFAGCGGSSLGYHMAGGRCLCAVEFDANAAATYRLNFPEVPVIERDIRQVSAEEVMEVAGLAPGQLDVLDGSPPCQGFSTAGKRQFGDPRNSLFRDYIRFLKALQPKAFVMENVSGLVKGKMKLAFRTIMESLKATGYRVCCKLLNAMWFGVPQSRQRLIWIGVRPDLGREVEWPKAETQIPLKAVLPWVVESATNSSHKPATKPATTIMAGGPSDESGECRAAIGSAELLPEECGPDISRYAIGAEWRKLKPGETSDRFFSLSRPDLDQPCPTITRLGGEVESVASVTHPTECRKFTIPELRRICSFPDDFKLQGTFADRWRVLGNSVPPQFMRRIAEAVRDSILLPSRQPEEA